MKFSKKTKIILISASFVCLLVIGWFGSVAHSTWKYKKEFAEKRAQKFENIEKSFNEAPNILDGMKLIDWYNNEKKDTAKAIYYSNECIRLGVNETCVGYLANYWLADIYQKTGDETSAKKYLRTALQLDEEKIILEHNWIDQSNLKGVLSQEEIESLADNI